MPKDPTPTLDCISFQPQGFSSKKWFNFKACWEVKWIPVFPYTYMCLHFLAWIVKGYGEFYFLIIFIYPWLTWKFEVGCVLSAHIVLLIDNIAFLVLYILTTICNSLLVSLIFKYCDLFWLHEHNHTWFSVSTWGLVFLQVNVLIALLLRDWGVIVKWSSANVTSCHAFLIFKMWVMSSHLRNGW